MRQPAVDWRTRKRQALQRASLRCGWQAGGGLCERFVRASHPGPVVRFAYSVSRGKVNHACRATYRCVTKLAMLYERWREIAQQQRQQMALRELSSARQWTFGQLAEQSERFAPPGDPISCPQGITPDFIFKVLSAWRNRQVLLPLETGQSPVAAANLPANIVHLKTTSASTGAPRLVAFTASQ